MSPRPSTEGITTSETLSEQTGAVVKETEGDDE